MKTNNNGWQVKSLGEVCEIIGGNPAPKGDDAFQSDGLPFVKMKDVGRYHLTNNLIDIENRVSLDVAKKNKLKLIKRGSILLPRSGSVALNHRAILGTEAYMVSHLCALEVKDFTSIYNHFLYYYLTTINFSNITKKTTGLDAITFEDLSRVKIPLPPLPIQKQIAEVLEKADQAKQKRKQANKLIDEFLQSVFIEMFGDPVKNPKGWNLVSLDKLGDWQSGGTPSRKISDYFLGNIPWYTSGELNSIYLIDSMEHITEKAIEESNAKLIEPNTILVGMYDTAAFKLGITTKLCSCNQAIAYSKVNARKVDKIFLYYLMKIGREYFISGQRGVRQKNLNLTMVRETKITLPPLLLQQQFAEIVNKTEALKEKQKQSEQGLENLFQSLMQKAFKGELYFN